MNESSFRLSAITDFLPDEVAHESTVQRVYFRMLNMPGKKKTSIDRWKETAVRFGAAQSVVPSQARYDELSYRQRALILKVSE